jgi:hypothetical protein
MVKSLEKNKVVIYLAVITTFILTIITALLQQMVIALLLSLAFGISVSLAIIQTNWFWQIFGGLATRDDQQSRRRIAAMTIVVAVLTILYLTYVL